MSNLQAQDGGVLAKTLGLLLIVALVGAGAMYVYGKRQQPLSVDKATLHATDTAKGNVVLAPGGRIYLATIVHNDGTFPVTLQGIANTPATNDQPYVATSVGLGDGKTTNPASAAAFTSVALKPGAGVGIFVVYEPNTGLACTRYADTPGSGTAFPPIPMSFNTYGVESTQSIAVPSTPEIAGFTRAQCEAAIGGG
ncbi:MAG: hypothetical protein ABJB55_08555 [Actinomycetota bacterium]